MGKLPVYGRERFDRDKISQLVWYDRYHTAMNSLALSFQKTDRVLTGDLSIRVKASTSVQNKMDFPGFTTGDLITLNYDKFQNIGSASTLVALKGLNYHELSHWLYTPRAETKLRTWLFEGNDRELFHYWNILEDQRIESLFRATYNPAGKHFTQMIIEFVVNDKEQWPLGYAMVYGRKFIPLEIRQGFKERWIGTVAERKQLETIIDTFKKTDWAFLAKAQTPASNPYAVGAKELIRSFKNLIEAIQRRTGEQLSDSSDCTSNAADASQQAQMSAGGQRPEQLDDSRNAQQKMEEQEKEQDKTEEGGEDGSGHWDDLEDDDPENSDGLDVESDTEGTDEEGTGAGEDSDDSGSESASEDSEGSGLREDDEDEDSSEGEEDEGDGGNADESGEAGPAGREGNDTDSADGDDDTESDGIGGDPNAGSIETSLTDEEFQEALDDIVESLEEHKQLQDDISQMRGALADPVVDLDEDIHATVSAPVSEETRAAAEAVGSEFSRLYAELEPGWKYGSDIGKLNAERWFRDHDFDDAFDEWDEGKQQDSGIEAVILLDTSASMNTGGRINLACQTTWALKKSLDNLDAKVSVITFDNQTRALYKRGDRVDPHQVLVPIELGGSTIPNMALHTARRILSESALPNKMLLAVTDGGWQTAATLGGSDETPEKIMESIDALKLYFMIDSGLYRSITEYFDISKNVSNPMEIIPVVAEAVNHLLEELRNQ